MDLTRFHETFFQECFEQLAVMETDILTLAGSADPEIINNLFRAAHSIKGASSTFGFDGIAQFAHLLESLLNLMREGKLLPRQLNKEVLLQAVDCLRDLVSAQLEQREPDHEDLHRATQKLEEVLRDEPAHRAISTPIHSRVQQKAAVPQPNLFIRFHPATHLFRSGTDPLLYLQELATLGSVAVSLDDSKLPSLSDLNTEDSFLGWEVILRDTLTTVSKVREAFEWVEGDCELTISKLSDDAPAVVPEANGPRKQEAPQSASIRVATDNFDALVNLVGELVITQSMLIALADEVQAAKHTKLREHLVQVTRNTREIQDTVVKIRMLRPVQQELIAAHPSDEF